MPFYKQLKKYLFLIFLTAIIFCLIISAIYGENVSLETIREFSQSLGIWLPISFMILFIIISIFFPSTPFMALAGIIFGFKYGLLYVTIAGFISAFITFYLSRILGKGFVDELLHTKFLNKLGKWNERIARHGLFTVIILRLAPIMPFNVLNLLMGISKVKARDYALGTLLGLAPSNLLAVYFGSVIVSVLL
jgi:uncharacterized membrane protein YdjX (TVP38/TMEM64 family)